MDFKSLLNKLDSMEAPPQTPAAPTIAKAVQLNEDAQLRVLSGRTSYIEEAKKKVDEEKSSTGGEIDRSTKGVTKHKENPDRFSDEPHAEPKSGAKSKSAAEKKDAPEQKKSKTGTWGMEGGKKFDNTKKESIEPEFKSKFMKMVEAAKEQSEAEKAEAKEKLKKKKEKMAKIMDEGSLPMVKKNGKMVPAFAADGKGKNDLGDEDDSDEGNDDSGKKPAGKKGMSAAQAKYFGKKNESKMMPKGKKRPVKESIENILSFKDMIKLVQESGGQQQIDAVDQELFSWAQRVAKQKIGEGLKADVYAGMVYERMGGVFEMYDVLSEDQK
jgi:hypothetical protein